MDIYGLAQQCSPQIQERQVVAAIAHTESSFNPLAIAVVGGRVRQPTNQREAILTVRELKKAGRNYSVGIAQVNQSNFAKYGLNESNMFDPCTNLRVGMSIYKACFDLANSKFGNQYSYDGKLRLAASCYYSGNFSSGFKVDFPGQPPYVTKFYNKLTEYRAAAKTQPKPINAPLTPMPVIQSQPSPMPVVNASEDTSEYTAIVNAIKLQNSQNIVQDSQLTKDEESQATDTPKKVEKKFSGDVFATPMSDVFSKQG